MQDSELVIDNLNSPIMSAFSEEGLNLSLSSASPHKDLWPLLDSEVLGFSIMFLISAIANAAGIGGGMIMIPLFVMLFYFETHTAVPLAQVMIFGGALIAVFMKVNARHPTRDRPLILYKLIMLVQAPMLLGATFGALVSTTIPSWLIELMVTTTVVFLCYNTTKKAIALYRQETKELSNERLLSDKPDLRDSENLEATSYGVELHRHTENEQLRAIYREETRMLPIKEILVIFGVWILAISFTFMEGGSTPSIIGITKCSPGFFGLIAAYVCICGLIFWYSCRYLIQDTEVKDALGYEWDQGDLKWTKKNTIIFGVVSMVIGFICGMLAFAVGMLLIPIILRYGVRPEQAAASSSFMVMFSTSVAILQFITSDVLNLQYALAILILSWVGSFTGIMIVKRLIERFRRPSILVFLLSFIMGIVIPLVPSYGIAKLISNLESGSAELGFQDFCK
jgi:uncharacterized membrane protein YfcA